MFQEADDSQPKNTIIKKEDSRNDFAILWSFIAWFVCGVYKTLLREKSTGCISDPN